jgi:hypothetical protein
VSNLIVWLHIGLYKLSPSNSEGRHHNYSNFHARTVNDDAAVVVAIVFQ